MFKGLIGIKRGMTQVFDSEGAAVPVTLIEAGPCFVTHVRKLEKEGYNAVQLGYAEIKSKRLSGGQLGHLRTTEAPSLKYLREFRTKELEVNAGDKLTVEQF
jgi:large subunit ribosomal protein L3